MRRPLLFATIVSASISGGCVVPVLIADRIPFTIATGGAGGVDHSVGSAICRIFNLAEERFTRPCVAVISDGSASNIQGVRRGETALALSQSDVAYAAYRGEGRFATAGPDAQLRTLITLHSEALAVIARAEAGIGRFEELRGKRISVGKSGVLYAVTRDELLASYGWTTADFGLSLELGLAEQNRALCASRVDAIMVQAAQPSGFLQEATVGCPARLLRLEGPAIARLLSAHPYYVVSMIPGGMYEGNPDTIPTFGTQALLVASARLSDELAYGVVRAVMENFADFRRLHPALSTLRISDMVPSSVVTPVHPGAMKYYREAGLKRE